MDGAAIEFLTTDRFSALGNTPVLVVDAAAWRPPGPNVQSVVIGLDWTGALPSVDPAAFDLLVTTADAPAPWVTIPEGRFDGHIAALAAAVRAYPMAAGIGCRVLRFAEQLPFARALEVESLAYSTLLGGSEFARWLASRSPEGAPASTEPLVRVERQADLVTITLNDPKGQNAITAGMRDALHAALANVLDDPSEPSLLLSGAGRCFSTGGALGEFGSVSDLAQAHVVRTVRSCASLLDRLGARATVRVQGACIGSGLEIAAAARRIWTADSWFQLPELRMGLIPGAGGTASVGRAIRRHRAAWMLLTGKRLDARRALDWGLIHEIEA